MGSLVRQGAEVLELLRNVRAKVPNVLIGVIAGLLVGGGAFAVAKTVTDDGHGGPKSRFHDAGECNLVDVSTLPGNWTHGDYVSAVEKSDPSKVREAAQSRCGKPQKGGPNNAGKDKSKKDKDESSDGGSKAKPSPKLSHPSKAPSPSPSATGTAGPVVPVTPSPTESGSPSPSPSAS
jgi:hypothetical protein